MVENTQEGPDFPLLSASCVRPTRLRRAECAASTDARREEDTEKDVDETGGIEEPTGEKASSTEIGMEETIFVKALGGDSTVAPQSTPSLTGESEGSEIPLGGGGASHATVTGLEIANVEKAESENTDRSSVGA